MKKLMACAEQKVSGFPATGGVQVSMLKNGAPDT